MAQTESTDSILIPKDPVWHLRALLAASMFAIVFGYMAYEDPSGILELAVGINIVVGALNAALYFIEG